MEPINVLVITYYWPPSGGPAVQRWLAFSNHLATQNVNLHVLTIDEKSANYPAIDQSLGLQVSSKIKIYKTTSAELYWIYKKYIGKGKAPSAGFANEGTPGLLQKIARFVRGNFFLPDARKSWNKYALAEARQIIKHENISIIITAGPPHSTHLVGLQLKKEFAIKWIADFHDAWTDVWYYAKLMHTPIASYLDKKMERTVLESADKILTVGRFLRKVLSEKSNKINIGKIELISMGYDESKFLSAPLVSKEEFIITYTGTIDGHYEPDVFFQAIASIKIKYPQIKFKIRFAGVLAEAVKNKIIQYGLLDNLQEMGYVSHEDSIKLLQSTTVLLLVSPKVKSENIIIPGKIYEYLAALKPIINIGSLQTESAMIINECSAGQNFDRSMVMQLEQYLIELAEQWLINADLNLNSTNNEYKKYGRAEESKRLYKIITNLIAD